MYLEFLTSLLHEERAKSLIYAINTLDELGVPDIIADVEQLIMAGAVGGNEGVLGKIEDQVGQSITNSLTQLGVGIEYDPQLIEDHMALLWFLATWGTSRGPVPSEVIELNSIYDLDGNNHDMLYEFYALAEGDDVSQLEWVTEVTPYLIRALDDTLSGEFSDQDDEVPFIPTSRLNPLRAFAGQYPNAIGIKHMNMVGNFSMSLNDLFEAYVPEIAKVSGVREQAIHFASLGLVSSVTKSELLEESRQLLITAAGATNHAQQLIRELELIYRNLGVI